MAAATGVGAGDLVATLIAGADFGTVLLWAAVLGALLKLGLAEAVGRWHLASGGTLLDGWRSLGRWATTFFGLYAVVWGFVYGATAMSASGLPLNAMIGGLSVRYWGVICGVVGFLLVLLGRYGTIEKIMKVLVAVMFVTVVGTAVLVVPDLGDVAAGLVPRLPAESLVNVLGLIGGVGGTITLAAYGYWTMARGWRGPAWIRMMRLDNAVGYVMTGIFVVAMLVVGADILAGRDVTSDDTGLLFLADELAARYGSWARLLFLVGFFAVSFTSLLGVWNGVSLLVADWTRCVRLPHGPHAQLRVRGEAGHDPVAGEHGAGEHSAGEHGAGEHGAGQHFAPEPLARYEPAWDEGYQHRAGEHSVAFRCYLVWLTFPPMALLFFDRPFQLTLVYGVLGAFFMPFLAITLLVLLNSGRVPRGHRSGWISNGVLSASGLLFGVLLVNELREYLST
ncbi:MAG: Nramp family divalent metal transporter [Actinomycetota bacterium]|nr:Nramp family divalent metal transporter [Actinomycetota bacterium]